MRGTTAIRKVLRLLYFRLVGEFNRDENTEHGRTDLSVKQQLRSYTDFVEKDIYERMLSMCSCVQQASHIHKVFTCICHEKLRERDIIYGRLPYTCMKFLRRD